jgi:hypothetical protein
MNKIEPNANLLKLMKEPERVAKRGKPPKGLLSSTLFARLEGLHSNKNQSKRNLVFKSLKGQTLPLGN